MGRMKHHAVATQALKRLLGGSVVKTDEVSLNAASFDGIKLVFLPEAVIFPRTNTDIGKVLKLANRYRVSLTVRGRGSSLTGSAAPLKGGWVLDLLAWNKIEIDDDGGLARVGPGANIAQIHREAEAKGWFYPPDPASKDYCTIGGNIACNAGGMRGGKYGVTRDFILALKGFLPTGEYVEWGTPTRKYSAGFNLRDLWIGSEGMLGVITEATLRLIPKPQANWTLLLAYKNEVNAFEAVRDLFASKFQPSICEFLDRYSVLCAERATGKTVFKGQSGKPVVLLEFAGSQAELNGLTEQVMGWAKKHAIAYRVAETKEETEELWAVRRKCSGAMFELGDSKLNEDIVVPMRQYVPFIKFLEGLRKSSGLSIPTFGHLGDGNLHVNIMYHSAIKAECKAAEKTVKLLMHKVVELGGAISGEHGIGLAKTPFLRIQHKEAQVKAMVAIKKALDPNQILNPGKMFEVFEVWKHKKLAIKLPWDHK
jgi:glycolate oxidase